MLQVHVNEHKVRVYNRIQEFHGNFTTDGINTQLHACNKDVRYSNIVLN